MSSKGCPLQTRECCIFIFGAVLPTQIVYPRWSPQWLGSEEHEYHGKKFTKFTRIPKFTKFTKFT